MEFLLFVTSAALIFAVLKSQKKNKSAHSVSDNKTRIPHRALTDFKVPIVNALYHLYKFKTEGTKFFEAFCERFGYLVEMDIGPIRAVVTADADVIKQVLNSTEPTHLNKTKPIYDLVFLDCFKDGLLNADFNIWAPHRKSLNRCFTYKCYVHYVKIMNKHARHLAKNYRSLSTPASLSEVPLPVDHGKKVFDLLYFYSVKIISQILMDTDKYGNEKMEEFTKNIQAMKHFVTARLFNPQLLFKPYWYFHPMKKQFDVVMATTKEFFKEMYTQCKMESERELMENDTEDDDNGIKPFRCVMKEMISSGATDKEIYDEIGTILGAGHETTVIAIEMLLQHLALNPQHQSRCREEVNGMFESKGLFGQIGEDIDCDITIDDLTSLKYLERCILESGRLTSTVPGFMRTLGSPLKLEKDLELASGTNVAILPCVLHKNPKYFPNPETFDPDRFLPENVKARHSYAFIPFSAGARNCIGYKVAIM